MRGSVKIILALYTTMLLYEFGYCVLELIKMTELHFIHTCKSLHPCDMDDVVCI